jgi:hypothetical protein
LSLDGLVLVCTFATGLDFDEFIDWPVWRIVVAGIDVLWELFL